LRRREERGGGSDGGELQEGVVPSWCGCTMLYRIDQLAVATRYDTCRHASTRAEWEIALGNMTVVLARTASFFALQHMFIKDNAETEAAEKS
jgi:hypothetical protein